MCVDEEADEDMPRTSRRKETTSDLALRDRSMGGGILGQEICGDVRLGLR